MLIQGLPPEHFNDLKYLSDGKYLLIINYQETLAFDVASGRLNRALRDHTNGVYGVSFSPDGQKLATCSLDCSIIIYSLLDFSILGRFVNNACVHEISFSVPIL
eukprot:TRINITY_DN3323_c1_g4_i1.p1 TRINITY_DN3323_c1_g4~~TRINITY_DN3323_c1_g4_i1.p1  ORF type:complete len:104 (-),score=14.35 TRINITY_DN3323_c1_g4_i1:1165-1476(-)